MLAQVDFELLGGPAASQTRGVWGPGAPQGAQPHIYLTHPLASLSDALGRRASPGGSGEGPGCHFLQDIGGLEPIPARIRVAIYFYIRFGRRRASREALLY